MTYAEWKRLPKSERASWIAHARLEAAVRQYSNHEEQLKKGGVSLDEWLQMRPEARDMKMFTTKILT